MSIPFPIISEVSKLAGALEVPSIQGFGHPTPLFSTYPINRSISVHNDGLFRNLSFFHPLKTSSNEQTP
jgi:hypothetical protein